MKLLVVSINPLFTEVLNAALEGHDNFDMSIAAPNEFNKVLANAKPDVIIVDVSLGQTEYEPILTAARDKTSSRIILLNPKDNNVCVLDSRRTIIQEIDDLCQAIARQIDYPSANALSASGDNANVEASLSQTKEVEQGPN